MWMLRSVIVAVCVVPTAGKAMRDAGGALKNMVSIDNATGPLLAAILDRVARRTVVLAMGNPYLVRDFPAIDKFRRFLPCSIQRSIEYSNC